MPFETFLKLYRILICVHIANDHSSLVLSHHNVILILLNQKMEMMKYMNMLYIYLCGDTTTTKMELEDAGAFIFLVVKRSRTLTVENIMKFI